MGAVTTGTRCPVCQADVPPGFRFCGQCGAAVATSASPQSSSVPRTGDADAERRQLTVVFCDLADSTRLAAQLDLEDLRDVVRAYQSAACSVIERYGGTVAQYLGDGILAYFGYPEAREDDARRAVRAALEVVKSVDLLNGQIDPKLKVTLGVRVAAHTGLVVTGDVGAGEHREELALGPTPNIAARLQEIAERGTVVIGDTTHRLVGGFFEFESMGERALKGRAEPMPVHRVVRETGAETLFDVALARGLSAAVGREAEITLLDAALARAAAGSGCAVLLRGEAGIGKSRIVQLIRERYATSAAWMTCRCSPDDRNSAMRPIVVLLERWFGFHRDDDAGKKLRRMEEVIGRQRGVPGDAVPLIAALLAIPTGASYAELHLGPSLQRVKTQEVLLSLLLASAGDGPTVLVIEDLHWADPSTLDLLALAVRRVMSARVLLLVTARPDFTATWTSDAGVAVLEVGRLGPRDVQLLATAVAGGVSLPPPVLSQLVARTDGVPLFVEEMTKFVIESGMLILRDGRYELREPIGEFAIPSTLHDSLLARLDRLGPAKAVAQLASVIGREFSLPMVRCVSTLDEPALMDQLGQLVDAGLLDSAGHGEEERYIFRHALIQDAAYQSLLKNTRRRYHRTMAETFSVRFPELRRAQPELFGAHYAAAGIAGMAIACWTEAAERSARLGSAVEAVTHCRSALGLLEQEPEGPDRNRAELELQMLLGDSLSVLQGYGSSEVASAYQRAQRLASDVDERSNRRFEAVCGLHRFHFLRGDFAAAFDCATELVDRASGGGPLERVIASYMLGWVQLSRAKFTESMPLLESGLATDVAEWGPPAEGRLPIGHGGLTQGAQVRCVARIVPAIVLSHLGCLDRALALTTEAVTLASVARQPYSEAFSLLYRALVHYCRRDAASMLPDARRVVEISREHGYYFATLGSVFVGWALANSSGGSWSDEAFMTGQRGLDGYRGAGARAGMSILLTMMAEAHRARGDAVRAAGVLDEAAAAAEETGERRWIPEIHRQRAALARHAGDDAGAVAELLLALDVAQSQDDRLLELRTALDLARLHRDQGGARRARDLLRPIIERFPERSDIADLREAAAFL
jgi:class 3 adenylate cyclase/tetratricopeptide (TPR) repeat protein